MLPAIKAVGNRLPAMLPDNFYCDVAIVVGRAVMCRAASRLRICPHPSWCTGLAQISLIWHPGWMLPRSHKEEWRDASGLGGSTMWITAEEMRQIHDEIWRILERYTQRVADPSLRPPDTRAARVFFFTGVSLRR